MDTRVVLEIIGWIGSALVVLSLAQARVWRFRVMNFAGAVLATFYNAVLGIWPFAAMNGVIAVIDAYWMVRLKRESKLTSQAYELVEVNHDDAFLSHFLKIHGEDARRHYPDFDPTQPSEANVLVMRGDEAVGVVVVSDTRDSTAHISLDYVTPRFRDFTPGRFVYENSGLFDRMGVQHLQTTGDPDYLRRMGFRQAGTVWTRLVRQP
jgi:hypothetical protein